jgi:hypothetical protein
MFPTTPQGPFQETPRGHSYYGITIALPKP